MKEYQPKEIFCPSCGCAAGTYDGRSTIDKIAKCQKCNKMVIYRVSTGKTENKPMQKRNCSSGMAFV